MTFVAIETVTQTEQEEANASHQAAPPPGPRALLGPKLPGGLPAHQADLFGVLARCEIRVLPLSVA